MDPAFVVERGEPYVIFELWGLEYTDGVVCALAVFLFLVTAVGCVFDAVFGRGLCPDDRRDD